MNRRITPLVLALAFAVAPMAAAQAPRSAPQGDKLTGLWRRSRACGR